MFWRGTTCCAKAGGGGQSIASCTLTSNSRGLTHRLLCVCEREGQRLREREAVGKEAAGENQIMWVQICPIKEVRLK